MKKKKLYTVLFILITLFFAACTRDEDTSLEYQPITDYSLLTESTDRPFYDIFGRSLISIWDDRVYFSYTETKECGCRVSGNRLAYMHTDGTNTTTFWQSNERVGTRDGRRYYIHQDVVRATGLPDGGVAAVIRTSSHWDLGRDRGNLNWQIVMATHPDYHTHLVLFDAYGEIITEYSFCAILALATLEMPINWRFDLHALSDGRFILQLKSGFYILDLNNTKNLENIILTEQYGIMALSAVVTPDDNEIIATMFSECESQEQLWRICIESGEYTILRRSRSSNFSSFTFHLGEDGYIYKRFLCVPDINAEREAGLARLNLETEEIYVLFNWEDIGIANSIGPQFLVSSTGTIYFVRHMWGENGERLGAFLDSVNSNEFEKDITWRCDCPLPSWWSPNEENTLDDTYITSQEDTYNETAIDDEELEDVVGIANDIFDDIYLRKNWDFKL